jgi:hypothetical protein
MSRYDAQMEVSGLLQRLQKLEAVAQAAKYFIDDISRLAAPIHAHYDRLKAALEDLYCDREPKRN